MFRNGGPCVIWKRKLFYCRMYSSTESLRSRSSAKYHGSFPSFPLFEPQPYRHLERTIKLQSQSGNLGINSLSALMAAMEAKLMRAVQYDGCGGGPSGLKHVEVPIPIPKKYEVLLKLEAATINSIDWKVQKGLLRPFLARKLPYMAVTDVAGEVVDVGEGVQKFKADDKVVAFLTQGNGGGFAEFATANESLTVTRPPEVSAAEGAGLPVTGLTAHQCLTQAAGVKLDGSGPQMNILVTAASGGVGHYVVQLAKLGNTHVTATCGARNIDFLRNLGVDEVLDYMTPEGESLNSPSGRKYDVVIHCSTRIPWSTFKPNLSPNGKVIDISPRLRNWLTMAVNKLTFSKKRLVQLMMNPTAENLDYLVKLVKEGKLNTVRGISEQS